MNLYLRHRAIALGAVFTIVLAAILPAQTSDDEKAKLKQQVEQLKQENQQLRHALAETPAAAAATPLAAPNQAVIAAPAASQDQGLTHWLTTSSNKRHNSKCRWFHNSRGRPCRADEGIPCKICGG